MSAIKIFDINSEEYARLNYAVALLNAIGNGIWYEVKTIYFDAGQGWLWTTIIAHSSNRGFSWQALTPKQQEVIVYTDSFKAVYGVVQKVATTSECYR